MATAGRILILPKGKWNSGATYENLDLVAHNGKAWLAKKTSVDIEPSDANAEFWHDFLGVDVYSEDNLPTEMVLPVKTFETVDEIESYLDNYSADFEDSTTYRARLAFHVTHPVLGVGTFDLIGTKTSDGYEWQQMVCYASGKPSVYMRSKHSGKWSEWYGEKVKKTYTGNGDATERTIVTGDNGYVCAVWGNGTNYLVMPHGATRFFESTIESISREEMKFDNGTLTIASVHGNVKDMPYYYKVLA